MNPPDYAKIMREIEAAQQAALKQGLEDAKPWFIAGGIWLIILAAYGVTLIMTAWHILRNQRGVDRLTWIFAALTLPFFGVLFYWILKEQDEHADILTLSRTTPTETAPQKTTSDIAAEITANLSARRR